MTADTGALWETFAAKAALLGASVRHVNGESELARLIQASAPGAVATRRARDRFPSLGQTLPSPAVPDGQAVDVVGSGELAVAETGSVLVAEANADRGATFLAQQLWLVVDAASIVPTLDDALDQVARLIARGTRYATLMTGPSRTADIERVMTVGVHGPGALTILVVDGEARTATEETGAAA